MTADFCFRALCAELVDNIHRGSSGMLGWSSEQEDELLDRARSALAQSQLETALTRASKPIPVNERLPGPGDLHPTDQWCWVCGQDCCAWHRVTRHFDAWSYWLPAQALPVPTHTSEND